LLGANRAKQTNNPNNRDHLFNGDDFRCELNGA